MILRVQEVSAVVAASEYLPKSLRTVVPGLRVRVHHLRGKLSSKKSALNAPLS